MDYVNLFVRSILLRTWFSPIFWDVFLSRSFQNGKNCGWTWTCVVFVLSITVPINYLLDSYLLRPGP